jgi:hypothetical protein
MNTPNKETVRDEEAASDGRGLAIEHLANKRPRATDEEILAYLAEVNPGAEITGWAEAAAIAAYRAAYARG